ncbi:MAG: substrate-binding domain-containing protein [Hyphomicrobiaceae bacterium]
MTAGIVRVYSTTAMKTVLDALAPAFEAVHASRVVFNFGPSGRMAKLVADGVATDVVIVTAGGIDELIAKGRVVAGTRVDIARSLIGVAVQKGAPLPDISTVEGFTRALLFAKSIAMSHPTGGAQSGAHLAKIFGRLGIAEEMRAKSIYGPGGPAGLVGNYLLRGEADVGLQQMPELMAVPGIDVVGPLPAEIQLVTIFSAGLSTAAKNVDGSKAWIEQLRSTEATAVIRTKGMEPTL